MHWHRAHFHDMSQRGLSILWQSYPGYVDGGHLSRWLHKSPDLTGLIFRLWQNQNIIVTNNDPVTGAVRYGLNDKHVHTVRRKLASALAEHAALGELYFAYGSNLNPERLITRNIQPRFVARARATGYTLGFPRRLKDGGGVAGLLPAAGDSVEGVLYIFSDDDFSTLDQYEGVPHAYYRSPVIVSVKNVTGQTTLARRLNVVTYQAVAGAPAAPTVDYLSHMITGARFWSLSTETCQLLESVTPAPAYRSARARRSRSRIINRWNRWDTQGNGKRPRR